MSFKAVILIRGMIKTDQEIKDTLHMLRLNRKHHCVIVKDEQKGMLQKVRSWITWGEITEDVLKKMIIKRGRHAGRKRVDSGEVDKIIEEMKTKKTRDWSIVPVFRLSPPSKGFRKSIRHDYPNGELGNRKGKINDLLVRMI